MKKIFAVILAALIALCCASCSSSINIYYQRMGSLVYYVYEIDLKDSEKNALEADSTTTVDDYFRQLCSFFPDVMTFISYYSPEITGKDSHLIQFSVTVDVSSLEQEEAEPDSNFQSNTEKGFWFNRVEITQSNPLAQTIASYDNPSPGTLMDIIVNGVEADSARIRPFAEIFPAVSDMDENGLTLEFYMQAPILPAGADGEPSIVDGVKFIKWSHVLGEEMAETVTYAYYYPNSIGWSVTLAVVSVIFVAVLWLINRKKADTSRLIDARDKKDRAVEAVVADTALEQVQAARAQDIDPFGEEEGEEKPVGSSDHESKDGENVDPFE